MTMGRHGRQRSSDLALASKWDEEAGETRLALSGHPMDLSDIFKASPSSNVPPHVLKTWDSLPDTVRAELVNTELSKAGLSASIGMTKSTSSTVNIGLTLSESFGSTIKSELSNSTQCDESRDDIDGSRRDDNFTPRSDATRVTVNKLPTPPHLLGLRAPDSASYPSFDDPPQVLRVLNAMPEYPIIGEQIKEKLEYSNLLDLLPGGAGSAILPTDSDKRKALSHDRLRDFVEKFDTLGTQYGICPGDRVGIAMPNGPELGMCLLSICSRACSVPVNPDGTADEIRRDLEAVDAKAVIALGGNHLNEAAKQLGIPLLRLIPSGTECGLFSIVSQNQLPLKQSKEAKKKSVQISSDKMSGPQDHALVLFTSGTSGKKKVVPYTLSNIVIGAACIIKSWDLRPDDINLNMMPLFHIGGIARNVFSPVFSGGGVVLCPGFDPVMFWDLLSTSRKSGRCTWYYASPTMHQAYVEEAAARAKAGTLPSDPGIRFIANAAGALLPALAERMKTTFNCSILPGYGMTECMPITAPPQGYQLERHGSSGRPIGPEVQILTDSGDQVPQGGIGNICVRGAPCFEGYEGNQEANEESFLPGGWFNTGDLGWVDSDDYLYITGRSKEVINRGGEIISPFEVEECLLQHPDILKPLCFAAPHDTLQETVGVALVMRQGCPRPTLKKLKKFCAGHLHPSKWPSVICFVDDLPKGPGSGKPQRVKFAERTELKELTDATDDSDRVFEAKVPPAGTPLSVKFPATKVEMDDDEESVAVVVKPRCEFERRMSKIWQEHLDVTADLSVDSSFFEAGGSSLMAGQLASSVRSEFSISMGVSDVFQHSTIEAMAKFARRQSGAQSSKKDKKEKNDGDTQSALTLRDSFAADARKAMRPHPPTRLAALVLQILPLLLWTPLRRGAVWIGFVYTWRLYLAYALDRYFSLLLALATTRIAARLVMPLVGIIAKWIIIGRYKKGRHPFYSAGYLRWWTCDQILGICGRGVFQRSNLGLRVYYRLMGAKIGKRVIIDANAKLSEFDLLTLEDDVVIDGKACIRPFALDRGTILLDPIHIGRGTSVGLRSVVAPGARVKANTSIGPQSSSYAVEDHLKSNQAFNQKLFAGPKTAWKVLGYFIVVLVNTIAYMPILAMLVVLTRMWWYHENLMTVQAVFNWFVQWQRVLFYLAIKAVNEIICPWTYFFAVVLVKRTIIGRFTPGPRDNRGGWGTTRYWIMGKLLPTGTLGGLSILLGKHYDAVSWCLRLLGAKVGKRIYWPGSGVQCTEHDLLEVGDDVVFGSRSTILTTDMNESSTVSIADGCFIADRCVLLPGTQMNRNSTIGSGGLTSKNFVAPPGSVYVGSEGNKPVRIPGGLDEDSAMKESTIRPFGRAFHRVDGFVEPYFVHREWMIILYHHVWHALCAIWHAGPIIASLQLARLYLGDFLECASTDIALCFLAIFPGIFLASQLLSLLGVIGIKWAVIGKRTPGSYRWDECNYCQRWQVFLCGERLRQKVGFGGRGILDFIRGSAYLNWYFRALGAKIGNGTCLYPTGGDPMMTEPDCVEIGNYVGVDEASIISHLNTKGNFSLQSLRLEDFATMRSSTRLLAGASMEKNSRLLEHTLIYSGEVTQAGSTWQGWPSKCIGLSKVHEEFDDDESTLAEV